MNYHKGIAADRIIRNPSEAHRAIASDLASSLCDVEKAAAYYITNLQVTFVGLVHAFEDWFPRN